MDAHPDDPDPNDRSPTCPRCFRTFRGYKGRRVHERLAHPTEYHREVEEAALRAGRPKARWSEEERRLLAREEARLSMIPNVDGEGINQRLHRSFPARTLEAIKSLRRREDYKQFLVEYTRLLRERPVEQSSSSESSSEEETQPSPSRSSGRGSGDGSFAVGDPETAEPSTPSPRQSPGDAWRTTIVEFLASLDPGQPGCGWGEELLDEAISNLFGGNGQNAIRILEQHALEVTSATRSGDRTSQRAPGHRQRPPGISRSNQAPAPTGRKRERRAQYSLCQSLYNKNRSAAAAHVLSGDWRVIPSEVEPNRLFEFWGSLFSRPSPPDNRPFECGSGPADQHLVEPITPLEVQTALRTSKVSAPGPDGITTRLLRSIPLRVLTKLFNLWLASRSLPRPFRACKTVLIPKIPKPETPSHYRPITMSSTIVRLFHKIVNSRVSQAIRIDGRQKAFIPVDGCAENLAILDALLAEARALKHPAHLAFLDMEKAFDSVSHAAIHRAMERKEVPEPLRDYIMSGYDGASTVISSQKEKSRVIPVTRGVKQGDPLSPFLFNLVIDEAITNAKKLGLGIRLGEERVSVLAFADDLVVAAETPAGLQALIDVICDTLSGAGLRVNAGKCRSLSLQIDGKRKKWYLASQTRFHVGGAPMDSIGISDEYKYLGILVGAGGRGHSYGSMFEEGIVNITQAPLKPQQRLYVLKHHLIPKMNHRLILGTVFKTQLTRIDRRMRQAIRSWLRLPHDTPNAFFYTDWKDGGLGMPEFVSSIRLHKNRRFSNLLESADPTVRAAALLPAIQDKMRRWIGPALIGGEPVTNRAECSRTWRERLYRTADGAGLRSSCEVSSCLRWISSGTRLLSGGEFAHAVQVRANALATPSRAARGRPGASGMCDTCRKPGTLGHISQACPRTHGARVVRHDDITRFVAGRLRQRGFEVVREVRIPDGGTFCKPDIIACKSNEAIILDTQVSADGFPLSRPHQSKCDRYGTPEILQWVREYTGANAVSASSITLNWRGGFSIESARVLKRLGLTSGDLEICSVKALTWTYSIYRMWSKSTGRG